MRKILFATALCGAGLLGASAPASAGCLGGAAVGGVAGHVAGHHAVLGAAAGCAIGHHEAAKHERQRNDEARNRDTGPLRGPDDNR